MAVKLWTVDFMRICIANLLLFVSLYVLFPVLSLGMSERLGISVAQTGLIFLFFTVGMFLIGPFHAYLIDVYKRKYVCIYSIVAMMAATFGYAFVGNVTELILLSTVQGIAFGMATTAGITLAIDVTNTTLRSAGNINFSWVARFGMILGIVLGVWIYHTNELNQLLYTSIAAGAGSILALSGVYVPFRAPIVTKLYSFDRFLLLRGWIPAVNMMLIMFVPGLLVSLAHPFLNDVVVGTTGIPVPLFVGTAAGYLSSLLIVRLPFLKEKTWRLVVLGLCLEIAAFSCLTIESTVFAPAIALGLGLGCLLPEFLAMFVKLSQHCQRGTANTTHLLSCEVGIALGIAASCHMDTDAMLTTGRSVSILALLFFLLIAYPYYRKMKVR